ADLGKLDQAAIDRVRSEAWPQAENADELHDAMMQLGFVTAEEGKQNGWEDLFAELVAAGRAAVMQEKLWVAAERLPQLLAVFPAASLKPQIEAPPTYADEDWSNLDALVEL